MSDHDSTDETAATDAAQPDSSTHEAWPGVDHAAAGNVFKSRGTVMTIGVVVVVGALFAVLAIAGVFKGHESNPAVIAACTADAKTVETGVGAYDALFTPAIVTEKLGNSSGKISLGNPSTYAHATQASKLLTNGLLRAWPNDHLGYAISLSSSIAGDVSIYVPATSTTPVDFETETATTGCNAL